MQAIIASDIKHHKKKPHYPGNIPPKKQQNICCNEFKKRKK